MIRPELAIRRVYGQQLRSNREERIYIRSICRQRLQNDFKIASKQSTLVRKLWRCCCLGGGLADREQPHLTVISPCLRMSENERQRSWQMPQPCSLPVMDLGMTFEPAQRLLYREDGTLNMLTAVLLLIQCHSLRETSKIRIMLVLNFWQLIKAMVVDIRDVYVVWDGLRSNVREFLRRSFLDLPEHGVNFHFPAQGSVPAREFCLSFATIKSNKHPCNMREYVTRHSREQIQKFSNFVTSNLTDEVGICPFRRMRTDVSPCCLAQCLLKSTEPLGGKRTNVGPFWYKSAAFQWEREKVFSP